MNLETAQQLINQLDTIHEDDRVSFINVLKCYFDETEKEYKDGARENLINILTDNRINQIHRLNNKAFTKVFGP